MPRHLLVKLEVVKYLGEYGSPFYCFCWFISILFEDVVVVNEVNRYPGRMEG